MNSNQNVSDTSKPTPDQRSGPSRARLALSYLPAVLFIALCSYYVYAHREDFRFVQGISFPATAGAGILILVVYLINAWQLDLFLRKFRMRLGIIELVALTGVMMLGNLVLPARGGSGALAVYLKKVHRLEFQAFAAIYAGTALLVALINTSAAMAALAMLFAMHGFFHAPLTALVVGMWACCGYLTLFPPPVKWQGKGLPGLAFEAARSWHSLTRDRSLLIQLLVTHLIIAACLTATFGLIYQAISTPLSWSGVLVTSSIGNLANLVPLTPGSLGIFDAVVIEVPHMLGMDPARSVAGALVFRVLCFFWAVVMGLPGMVYLAGLGRERT